LSPSFAVEIRWSSTSQNASRTIGAARTRAESVESIPKIRTTAIKTSNIKIRVCPVDAWRLFNHISK